MTRTWFATAVALLTVFTAGCGYTDDNREAARIVAQAYLTGYHEHNSADICRLLGPGQLQMYAGRADGSCERAVAAGFEPSEPSLKAGSVREIDDGVLAVSVEGKPDQSLVLMHMASTWRIVQGWRIA
jgi:hypothetical protein